MLAVELALVPLTAISFVSLHNSTVTLKDYTVALLCDLVNIFPLNITFFEIFRNAFRMVRKFYEN